MLKRRHRVVIATLIVVICMVISYFYLISHNKIGEIYQDETQNTIVNIKKSFLKNTVDNLIYEIEVDRRNESERYERIVKRRYETLIYDKDLTEDAFVKYYMDRFSMDVANDSNASYWTVLLWNKSNSQLLFDPNQIAEKDIASTLEKLKPLMSYYKIVEHGQISGFFGVSKKYVDGRIKESTADKIKSLKFDNDSYIWVNEVINYDGGNNYAIRRVHPNLPNTEGMYLSTEITDIKGNHPYLIELEGVKKDGELFFSYYFKELSSNKISKKLTYAKLYKDFDWIIAMGIYIDDIQQYIDQTNEKSKELATTLTIQLISLLIIVVAICLLLLVFLERWYYKRANKQMELEINKDPLTKACSRRSGTNEMIRALKEFKKRGTNSAIMLFDIDNFKSVNDSCGHDVGDKVLKEIANMVNQTIRSTDKLIRWGGDEFVAIFFDLTRENALNIGEKILSVVSSLKIPAGNEVITPTISMGITYFSESDEDIAEVLKRADLAMYQSKAEGRNRVNLL